MGLLFRSLRWMYRKLPRSIRANRVVIALGNRAIRLTEGRNDHQVLYDEFYYAKIDEFAQTLAPHLARLVADLRPTNVVDVGCGTGAVLAAIQRLGIPCRGLEHSEAALAMCRTRGLTVTPFDLEVVEPAKIGESADVAICTEVAEHLPPQRADPLVGLLVRLGKVVVFTAATPGQGGTDHVNEQPHSYWIAKFAAHSFAHDRLLSDLWRADLAKSGAAWFYPANLMIFRAESSPL